MLVVNCVIVVRNFYEQLDVKSIVCIYLCLAIRCYGLLVFLHAGSLDIIINFIASINTYS